MRSTGTNVKVFTSRIADLDVMAKTNAILKCTAVVSFGGAEKRLSTRLTSGADTCVLPVALAGSPRSPYSRSVTRCTGRLYMYCTHVTASSFAHRMDDDPDRNIPTEQGVLTCPDSSHDTCGRMFSAAFASSKLYFQTSTLNVSTPPASPTILTGVLLSAT